MKNVSAFFAGMHKILHIVPLDGTPLLGIVCFV
jgi:hypothetical protein